MAGLQPVSFQTPSYDYSADVAQIERKRALANALQQQSISPIDNPPPQPGGFAVRQSPLQGVAKLVQAYSGAKQQEQADEKQRELGTRYQADVSADMQALVRALRGTPMSEDASGNVTPAQPPSNMIPQMRTPVGQQMASTYMAHQLDPSALFGKVEPKDYTPESIAAYAQTRNPASLVAVRPAHFADTGNTITPLNPVTGAPQGAALNKGMTPDASANLEFRKFEFNNLSAAKKAELGMELKRLGLSEKQLEEGRVQLIQDQDGNVHLVNKITGVGTQATGPNGQPLQIQRPMTEVQGKANIFGTRADEADKVLRSLEDSISVTGLATKRGIENTPIVGGPMGALANTALSANQQKVEQAQRDFVNAVLRLESGAAISESEFKNAQKQYFPQPGDSPAVIEQKRRNRATEIAGLRAMAGRSPVVSNPGANQPFSQPVKTVSWNNL